MEKISPPMFVFFLAIILGISKEYELGVESMEVTDIKFKINFFLKEGAIRGNMEIKNPTLIFWSWY